MIIIYEKFKAEIVKVKRLRGLTNADIADMIGLKKSTVDMFMTNPDNKNRADSDAVAEAISTALNIKLWGEVETIDDE